jgi:hypothetical protein
MAQKRIKRTKKDGAITREERIVQRDKEVKSVRKKKDVRYVKVCDYPPTWKEIPC